MNQPDENPKLTTADYLAQIKTYGIEFEGRILPGKWGEYKTMFEAIRQIGELRPDKLREMLHPDDEYLLDKTVKASELTKAAWHCLGAKGSEYSWRKEVEFKAFERFDSEVICPKCLNRRWKPKFEAKPIDPADAEELQRRRERRRPCTCTPLQLAGFSVDNRDSHLFATALDKHIDHEGLPEKVKKRLNRQRPDGVIGLGLTPTLRRYLPDLQTRYCPFKNGDVAYPFIVIEAKSAESGCTSFGSILRQTAFVVRTCLRLQQNLQDDTGIPHQCIVWSFAMMGEEWRLYAAVPNGSNVQIFDLWHGTVLFPEGALQLLVIIDYICDWACEIYRMSILRCLTGNEQNVLDSRLSPSGTDRSSVVGDAEMIARRAMSLPSRSSLVPELVNDEMMGFVSNNSSRFLEIEPLVQIESTILSQTRDFFSWQRWNTTEQDPRPWVRKATIRRSNCVELSSFQVTMPEEIHVLQSCLNLYFPDLSVKNSARKLLISLQDDNVAVTTSVKVTSRQGNHLIGSIIEVRALVYFRSMLRPEGWQILRRVLCILCSEKAIHGLAHIADLRPSIYRSTNTVDDIQCKRFLQAINSLNVIGGTRSAGLAIVRRELSLRAAIDSTGSSIFEWKKFSPMSDDGVTGEDLNGIMHASQDQAVSILGVLIQEEEVSIPGVLIPYIKHSSHRYIVPVGGYQQGPPATDLEVPNFRSQGVLISKSNTGWVETAQDFCFFIVNENIQFDDEARLGRLLEESYGAKDFYKVGAILDRADRELIDRWIRILKGQLPQDTLL